MYWKNLTAVFLFCRVWHALSPWYWWSKGIHYSSLRQPWWCDTVRVMLCRSDGSDGGGSCSGRGADLGRVDRHHGKYGWQLVLLVAAAVTWCILLHTHKCNTHVHTNVIHMYTQRVHAHMRTHTYTHTHTRINIAPHSYSLHPGWCRPPITADMWLLPPPATVWQCCHHQGVYPVLLWCLPATAKGEGKRGACIFSQLYVLWWEIGRCQL